MTTSHCTRGALLALSLLCAHAAQALTVTRLSPQGEVAQVRQVVARFDAPAVRFGDPKAPAPFVVSCSDASASRGQGRWLSDRQWVYDFAADLPPGVRCTVSAQADFKSASGAPLSGAASYRFNTGGPFVQQVWPGTYQEIDEEQFFVLRMNGPATQASVLAHVWCAPEDLGERVPVRAVDGAQRAALFKALGLTDAAKADPQRYATLTCARRLTAGSKLQLVFGKGVATPSGIANQVEKRFGFTVRPPFTAEFSCERENAFAACLPIRPMNVSFSAPVTRKQALALRLKGAGQTLAPVARSDDGDEDAGDAQDVVHAVQFRAPFAVNTAYVLELPKDFKDASGRALENASSFPLKAATGPMPPLAKFAAAPFGVIERFAEGPDGPALLPVTLRNVEADLAVQGLQVAAPAPGKVSALRPQSDAEIIAWQRRLQRYDDYYVSRAQAGRDVQGPLPPVLQNEDRNNVQTRMVSLLAGQSGVQTLALPKADAKDPRPFEVVGIPLQPGFSVVEIASPLLGQSLLDARYGGARTMYVRTSALVTNLGVHFKLGREGSMAWVTTLDKGQPVAGAQVRVSDCKGREMASARTNAEGVALFPDTLSSRPPICQGEDDGWRQAYFVSARTQDDMAFVWSDWQRGIEPWRFNLPTSSRPQRDTVAHTVFDRTLLRAGETVSMKHLLRTLTGSGFAVSGGQPDTLTITHVGSGQQYTQPLVWRKTGTGGLNAESEFHIPKAAKLGVYEVQLGGGNGGDDDDDEMSGDYVSGSFRVEEFRLPVLEGRVGPQDAKPLVRARSVPTAVQVNYVSGGPAAQLPVRVSAMVRGKSLNFPDYDSFNFNPPRRSNAAADAAQEAPEDADNQRVIADRLPLTLDKHGSASLTVEHVPTAGRAQELLLEATYADPSGEVQTLRSTHTLWPAAVIAGVKAEGWASSGSKVRWQALALTLDGKAQADVPLSVQAIAHVTTSTRKRMVGGFYSYDNKTETKDLGIVCSGKSDSRGLLLCESKIEQSGEIELVVTARDKDGNEAKAATSVWITQRGELWFGGQDNDRIDLLPEKKSYQPGETARFQVRMPYRNATALLTVEREGILQTHVVQLDGKDPTVAVKIDPAWAPNVYVSVLALRGRLREVPWYSFFTWGFKAPREWWTAFWHDSKEYVAPTAMVDLSKPSYRMGAAEIRVASRAHQLDVKVASDKPSYPVRGKAQVTISVKLPDGKPAAGAEVALAAVDQALLELMPNTSWDLLDAMLQRRSWGVQTSTAQMEIVGRRHYGKKAAPPGGGGGHAATRELLDTLLLWKPAVVLDANGQAKVTVPLNDALTTFKIVAVADFGAGMFGTGSTRIAAAQDLQIISGLPPLVREEDQFRAQLTLRNTTKKDMKVEVTPRATLLELAPQTVDIAAGQAREVSWDVTAPAQLGQTRTQELLWEISARDTLGGANAARDALKVSQRILPAVPLTVQQATLVQLDGSLQLDVAPPADALPGRGGLKIALQPKLAEGLPGVRDWWQRYPYSCLEQKTSKAIGLNDPRMWQSVAAQLPSYLDGDGLAYYFPPRDGVANRGSDTLTAYILAATHEASGLDPAFALPDEARAAMERGLIAFVEGRIERRFWSPRKDLDMRKLAAIEALSRYGRATPRMLESITIAPNQWPTHAVIDWYNILKRMPSVPRHDQRLQEATQILQARLSYQGTKLIFSTEQDDAWWWLMQGSDVNTARLLLAVLDDPAWKDDVGRLANGFIARQQSGAWHTTTANLWGALALEKFSARFEATPVTGSTRASLGAASASVDWSKMVRAKTSDATGAAHQTTWFGAPAAPGMWLGNTMLLPWSKAAQGQDAQSLALQHQGTGKPWVTLQSVAAVQLKAPFASGYSVKRSVTPVQQANPKLPAGTYARGDVLRVRLEITAQANMTWVAVTDPIPGGSTILGSGLGRDSAIATQGEKNEGNGWPAFEERSFEAYRSYYEYLPKGTTTLEYTLRLNNAGDFALPPTRVEALYAPEMFGEAPNARVRVQAQ